MTQDAVIQKLHALVPALQLAGLKALYLFGSTGRGDRASDSDVDLAFEVEATRRFSLLDQAALQIKLSEALATPVDLLEIGALKAGVRQHAEREFVRIF